MSFSRDEFIQIAESRNHSPEFISDTVSYAENLQKRNLPVIFSTSHMALILGLDFSDLKQLIEKREGYYKFYKIKKKNGGERQIISPYNNLRQIQHYINVEILSKVRIDERATGFVKKRSIFHNANFHKDKDAILNIDLLKFFDTIGENRIYGIFKSLGYAKNLSVDLAKLTTVLLPEDYFATFTKQELNSYRRIVKEGTPVLPQGAPTSPALSNLVLNRLDKRLTYLGLKLGVSYSRYADDLTFSGELTKLPNIKLIRHIISDEGFNINWNKVGIYKKGRLQMVTGLTVSNGVHIHRSFKKEVKKHLYGCVNFGVEKHLSHIGASDKKMYKEWLLGKIFFIKSIEPEVANKMLIAFKNIQWPI